MTKRFRYSVVALCLLAVVISGISLFWSSSRVNAANTQVKIANTRAQAQCRADNDIAGSPVIVTTPIPAKPPLSVKVVSDFRIAWHQAGCAGAIASPDPTFVKWATHYGLPTG